MTVNDIERITGAFSRRYRPIRELGRNGWVLYLAQDVGRGGEVDLWVTANVSPVRVERFHQEMAPLLQLQHPHIVPILAAGREAEFLFYVVPPGGDWLRDRLRLLPRLPIADAISITRNVADALAYAHGGGVVHGDIRPESIAMVGDRALVGQFEWRARGLRKEAEPKGFLVGSLEYAGPERFTEGGSPGHSADIYSLGCLLYEMLAGHPPFVAADARTMMKKVLEEQPISVRRLRPDVTPRVEAALDRALAKSPALRFATALEFAEAL